jgi:endonuclease/exonuclease/phosphatase family metal-dependent hydrolase
MKKLLRIATWNIHKGFSAFNRRIVVHELRQRLRELDADIVLLQEVQGEHSRHAERRAGWPTDPQHEFLAAEVWDHAAYGRNVIYDHGHHGNAILSRYPILQQHNQDVTHLRFEKRGLLHTQVAVPGLALPLHCVSVHLSLLGRSRQRQTDALAKRIEQVVPADAPLLIGGDFNDWGHQAGPRLAALLDLEEAHVALHRAPALSFPARFPLLPLDRIYVRGLVPVAAIVHRGGPWAKLSDHAALSAEMRLV